MEKTLLTAFTFFLQKNDRNCSIQMSYVFLINVYKNKSTEEDFNLTFLKLLHLIMYCMLRKYFKHHITQTCEEPDNFTA